MSTCPTVRIKSKGVGGFVIINEADFDPEKHELFVEIVKLRQTKLRVKVEK